MAYDTNRITKYTCLAPNTDAVFTFKGPKGKAGLLYDYGCQNVTTAFAGATTTPHIMIGTAADDDHYGDEFDLGALATTSGGKSLRSTYKEGQDAGWDTYMLIRDLPMDTTFVLKWVAATGGGAAGAATAYVEVIWNL